MYNLSLTLTKLSIILLYLRLFVGKCFRRACWTVLALVIACGLWNIITTIFSCNPVAYYWDKSIRGGRCLNNMALWLSTAAFRIATDLAILALPMPVVLSLQLPRKQKIGLILVFAVGGV